MHRSWFDITIQSQPCFTCYSTDTFYYFSMRLNRLSQLLTPSNISISERVTFTNLRINFDFTNLMVQYTWYQFQKNWINEKWFLYIWSQIWMQNYFSNKKLQSFTSNSTKNKPYFMSFSSPLSILFYLT